MLQETSIGVFKPTKFTLALLQPVFGEWINHLYDTTIPYFFKTPECLAQKGYKNPVDPADGAFQYTTGWKGDLFHYYDAHPREGESFNHVMGGVMALQAGWLDIFPHNTPLNPDTDLPLLVDVEGNVARITAIGYSTTGACAYYMHGMLHDWSDEPTRKILEMQKGAMTPGYSTLLIHDYIAPKALAHLHTTAYDLTMMVMVAGEERTESHWRELLKSADYEVVRIWRSPLAVQGIIEAEIAK
ncbi:hypothetical protein OEA41_004092 [Lepraria neglecta]|uniref:O-methyltransferase C-terminal domain-containing protein n=1 Tax=Lepraria neglecta TaxID=209136 RepID=A0AAD9Z6Y6_9LECA|nr:hypothetical protein OEA41_004092 [Lepraria neglecta]